MRSLTRNFRKSYEEQLVQNVHSKPKAFWQYIISRLKVRPSISKLFAPDGSSVFSDSEMATLLNDCFSSVFTVEDTTTIPTAHTTASTSATDSIDFTPNIVFSKVMNLQSGKSPGPDGWPIEIIKLVGESISLPLSIIFTKSYNSGTLPHDWKSADVTPIHKKGARNLVSNYRPVSLTSIFCKLMESIIKDHIMSHLMDNNLDLLLADLVPLNSYMF